MNCNVEPHSAQQVPSVPDSFPPFYLFPRGGAQLCAWQPTTHTHFMQQPFSFVKPNFWLRQSYGGHSATRRDCILDDVCVLNNRTHSLVDTHIHTHPENEPIIHSCSSVARDLANMWREGSLCMIRTDALELPTTICTTSLPPIHPTGASICSIYIVAFASQPSASRGAALLGCHFHITKMSGRIRCYTLTATTDLYYNAARRWPRHRSTSSWVKDGGFINIIRNNQKICHHHVSASDDGLKDAKL